MESIVPGTKAKVRRGRRSKVKVLERRDVYRELVSTAMSIIHRVGILHRTFAEEEDYPPTSWLYQYADNPYLTSTIRKIAVKRKPFNQYSIEDVKEFYATLTHEEFKQNLVTAETVEVDLHIEEVRPELVIPSLYNSVSSFDNNLVEYTPICKDPVTLEYLSSLPHEDRILRVLPPLCLNVNIRAELRTQLQPPQQLLDYCMPHVAQKRRAFSILLYAPPFSGVKKVKYPAPVQFTDDFDNWISSYPICVTNIFSLLGKGVINIAVIPEEFVFSDRLHQQGCVCDGIECHLRYLDVLKFAKHADIIHYTNSMCDVIEKLLPRTIDINDYNLYCDLSPPQSPVYNPHDPGPTSALPPEPLDHVGIG